eukprot:TRINITY_DN7441_c0_g1_i5.p1 TRINITY_DN7441_c0_g1~~TRINITY_DN7441_c0_g1_i5.p1  ORF type:complete len:102 (-),score=10.94 TRINITY_DN7441_c0_g1_i5:8-313(-)
MHDKLKESKYRDTERISKQESITDEKSHIYYFLLSLCSLDQMNCTLCWSCLRSFLCMVNSIFYLLLLSIYGQQKLTHPDHLLVKRQSTAEESFDRAVQTMA